MNINKDNHIEYYDKLQTDDESSDEYFIKIYPFNDEKSYKIRCIQNCKDQSSYNINMCIVFILSLSLMSFLTYIMIKNNSK